MEATIPYDSNGNFSLVPSYKAVSGDNIRVEQHNPPLEDIANGMSLAFLRNGAAPMQAPINMNGYTLLNLGASSEDSAPATNAQLEEVKAMLKALVPPGSLLYGRWVTAPAGWVKEDGGTIGSTASGATTRANADTIDLYTHLWNTFNNTKLPIQNSSGAASTRGSSAAADFAANKRLPLFDTRTRFIRGSDEGLGFDASLTVGAAQSDAFKNHSHDATSGSAGAHVHQIERGGNGGGSAAQNGPTTSSGFFNTESAGAHTHPITVQATGDALETRPRSSVALSCIKL